MSIKREVVENIQKEELGIKDFMQLIPTFNTSNQGNVYRFIRSCDTIFSLASPQQCPILLTFALNKIDGPGTSDVHMKQYSNWDELKTFLIEKFSNVKTISHYTLELQSMFQKPSESVTEYYHRVDLCRSKIMEKINSEIHDTTITGRQNSTEETALNVFINGLNSDLGIMLRTQRFKNLSDAGRFAMQEDKIRAMNSARQLLFKTSLQSQNKIPLQSPSPQFRYNKHPQLNERNYINLFCNYCKNPGHLLRDCRKRAFNNNRRPFQPAIPSSNVKNLNYSPAIEMSRSMGTGSECSPLIEEATSNIENLQL